MSKISGARLWKGLLGLGLLLMAVGCVGSDGSAFSDADLNAALTEVSAERTMTAEAATSTPHATKEDNVSTAVPDETATQAILATDPHGDGIYIVGAQIAPGVWRSQSSDQRFCYWARRKYDGVVLNSYYGLPGIEMRVQASDYEIEFDGCGMWVYMGAD